MRSVFCVESRQPRLQKKKLSASHCELCHSGVNKCYVSSLTQHHDFSSFFLPVVLTGRYVGESRRRTDSFELSERACSDRI